MMLLARHSISPLKPFARIDLMQGANPCLVSKNDQDKACYINNAECHKPRSHRLVSDLAQLQPVLVSNTPPAVGGQYADK